MAQTILGVQTQPQVAIRCIDLQPHELGAGNDSNAWDGLSFFGWNPSKGVFLFFFFFGTPKGQKRHMHWFPEGNAKYLETCQSC